MAGHLMSSVEFTSSIATCSGRTVWFAFWKSIHYSRQQTTNIKYLYSYRSVCAPLRINRIVVAWEFRCWGRPWLLTLLSNSRMRTSRWNSRGTVIWQLRSKGSWNIKRNVVTLWFSWFGQTYFANDGWDDHTQLSWQVPLVKGVNISWSWRVGGWAWLILQLDYVPARCPPAPATCFFALSTCCLL